MYRNFKAGKIWLYQRVYPPCWVKEPRKSKEEAHAG